MTKCSRGIHNAWHSWFKSAFVSKVQLLGSGGRVVHPLTRR
ncbi:DUF3265 domain-containing protein [Vibrio parahaemolyticus]|nr:DUF3265 domain-containing protein [Vibrio parahaemolyticus]